MWIILGRSLLCMTEGMYKGPVCKNCTVAGPKIGHGAAVIESDGLPVFGAGRAGTVLKEKRV